jgi:hypothetical protein
MWEIMKWMIKSISKSEVGEGVWEIVKWMIKCVSKSEVGKGGEIIKWEIKEFPYNKMG